MLLHLRALCALKQQLNLISAGVYFGKEWLSPVHFRQVALSWKEGLGGSSMPFPSEERKSCK